jgi:tRNA-splicing ligase RtcB
MTILDKVVPNLVGVDIGCGMSVAKINIMSHKIDFKNVDKVIRNYVPSGFKIRTSAHPFAKEIDWQKIICPVDIDRAKKSIGTLGGGNHFIEVNKGSDGSVYLVIHSGSRNLGKQIAEHYQKIAEEQHPTIENRHLAYLSGAGFSNYLNDMEIAQKFASLNRRAMIEEITKNLNWQILDSWECIHNFIEIEAMILRKGATSARLNQKILIPINMRDGSIIAVGKGNSDWNYSAPHGAGRVMSRTQAKKNIRFEDFQESMKNVWTTSVHKSTIDESPFVYKPLEEIVSNIKESVDIIDIIKPIYNFKA